MNASTASFNHFSNPSWLDLILDSWKLPSAVDDSFRNLTKEDRKTRLTAAQDEIKRLSDSFDGTNPQVLTENGKAAYQINQFKDDQVIQDLRKYVGHHEKSGLIQSADISQKYLNQVIDNLADSDLAKTLKTLASSPNKEDQLKAAKTILTIADNPEAAKLFAITEPQLLKKAIIAGRLADVARDTTFNPLLWVPNVTSNSWNWLKTRFTKEDFSWKPVVDKKANLEILMDLAKTKPAATPSYKSVFKFGEEWKNASGFGAKAGVLKDGTVNLFSGGYKGFIDKTGNFGKGANLMRESMWDSVKGISSAAMSKSFVSTPVNWFSSLPPWGKALMGIPLMAGAALGVRCPGVGNVADLCLGQGAGANLQAMTNCNPTKLGDNIGGFFKFALGNVLPFFAVPMIAAGLVATAPVSGAIGAMAMATGAPAITTFLASAGINLGVGLTMNKFTETVFGNLPSDTQHSLNETEKLIAEAERLTGQKIDSNSSTANPGQPNSQGMPNMNMSPEQMATLAASFAKAPKV